MYALKKLIWLVSLYDRAFYNDVWLNNGYSAPSSIFACSFELGTACWDNRERYFCYGNQHSYWHRFKTAGNNAACFVYSLIQQPHSTNTKPVLCPTFVAEKTNRLNLRVLTFRLMF